ncbi:TlpA family protein disulfide reductase [Desulfobulbus propionicus]|jgi:peroxiredoxin
MRGRWILVSLCLLLAGCPAFWGCRDQGSGGLTGRPAPEFAVTMLDGRTVSLKELRGKPVLLEFWAPWCGGCLENIPPLRQLHQRFGGQIALIAASSETGKKTVARFVSEHGLPYPVALSNQQLLDAFQVSAIPVTVLIDREGVVRYHHAGQFALGQMEQRIRGLL